MKITENRYSGIPTIRREVKEWGMPEPEFKDERGIFSVCLRKTYAEPQDGADISTLILDFCKTPRSRKEITRYLNFKTETYAINKYVLPLVEKNLIALSIPGKPSSSKQKYTTVAHTN